ncbi:MAG: Teichuronic acid biosynthesis protein TuaB [Candidatus Ordinivivax streblomastigis]|uniref:Teichuronic acid biosynthesis protein TuaB n=1 Tax=Candidatus Ordinivivax streblomastigis TaxID=2540710 RepID=A0A5M8P277_9BACT|nr:MAG: Teichuronic acid biosynthesis protein TuaB [Candidatus Ordinivivax streblomastigis]
MPSLKSKSVHGFAWNFTDSVLTSGILFVTGVILARILSPDDFGLLGIITVFIGLSTVFIDSGFSTWLIRKPDCTQQDYSTSFFFNIIVSISLYLLLYVFSPAISSFFNQPLLIGLIRTYSLVLIIDSLAIIQRVHFIKRIDFKRQMYISILSAMAGGGVGVSMAFCGYGVWSLVCQAVTRQGVNTILFWILSSWRPSFLFSKQSFQELFGFGNKILFSGLITSLQNNIYFFIIGKYFTPAVLGFYTRAEQFNAMVVNNIGGPVERVLFPSLSVLQNDDERLKEAIRKTIKISFLIIATLLLFLAAIAKPLLFILIGGKWMPSVILLQLMCIATLFYPVDVINLNILKIRGRSDLILRLQIIKIAMFIPNIVIGIFYGLVPLLITRIFTTIICTWVNSRYSGSLLNYSIQEQVNDVFPIFLNSSIALLPVYLLSFLNLNLYILFTLQICLSLFLLYSIFEYNKHSEYVEIKEITCRFVKKAVHRNCK